MSDIYKAAPVDDATIAIYLQNLKNNHPGFIDDLRKYNLPEEKLIELFNMLSIYCNLEERDKITCQKTLTLFFKLKPFDDIFLEFISQFKDPYIIMDFSRILLTSIYSNAEFLTSYQDIDFPQICISLMSMFPEFPFPYLIKICSITLKHYDTKLLNTIKDLMHQCENPMYYGILIYRFAELFEVAPEDQNKMIPICEYLLEHIDTEAPDYKYVLQIISLLFRKYNQPLSFYCGFKNSLIKINSSLIESDCLDEEDIINILDIIQQYVSKIDVIPELCKKINRDFISALTQSDNELIRIKSLSIIIQILMSPSFFNHDEFIGRIQQFNELPPDLSFNLKTELLPIYTVLCKNLGVNDIDISINETFVNNICDFLICGEYDIVFSMLQICAKLVQISPRFAAFLFDNVPLLEDLLNDEPDFSELITNIIEFLNSLQE